MGVFDFLFSQKPIVEAAGKEPKLDYKISDPFGTPVNFDPMSDTERKDGAFVVAANLRLAQVQTRAARLADFAAMDKSDIAAMLTAVTYATLTFEDSRSAQGFKVECEEQRANDIIQLMLKRTELQDKIFDFTREMLKWGGDHFVEPIFTGKDLVALQSYDPNEMSRNHDDKGRLSRGKDGDGFWTAFQQKRQGTVIAGWQPWEMIHFRYWPNDRDPYSVKGLLDDIRLDWRKLEMVEEGMVGARVTRAYPRRVHYIDGTDMEPDEQKFLLAEYMKRATKSLFLKKTRDTVTNIVSSDVSEDLYVLTGSVILPNGNTVQRRDEVKTEDPAMAGLENLGDVEYLRAKVWSQAPADIVGIRRNTTGDLDSQDLAYARMLRHIQHRLEIGIRAIIDQQLLAYGIIGAEYQVVFPTVIVGAAWKHADARFKDSLTLRNYLEMGAISRRWAIKRSFNMSDAQVDDLFAEILEEAMSPIFQPVLPFRNGQPVGLGDMNSPNTADGEIGDAKNKAGRDSLPSADTGAAATLKALDPEKADAVTNNGIYRGTDLGKRVRGNFGG